MMTGLRAAILVAALSVYAASGVRNVEPDETGVSFVFGRATETFEPGLHWTWPMPIGRLVVEKTATNQTVPVGYASDSPAAQQISARATDLWMTGGSSMIRARLDVQYTVSDLQSFLIRGETPTEILRAAAERTATRFLLQSSVDEILTSRRQVLRQEIQVALQELLDRHGLGIQVRSVEVVELSPPSDGEVDIAFQQVQSARSDRERAIQDALAQQSQIVARAEARARELEERSRSDRFARVELAKGQAERFIALAREHAAAPAMTERRLFLEKMEKLLPRAKLFVVEPAGNGRLAVRPAG